MSTRSMYPPPYSRGDSGPQCILLSTENSWPPSHTCVGSNATKNAQSRGPGSGPGAKPRQGVVSISLVHGCAPLYKTSLATLLIHMCWSIWAVQRICCCAVYVQHTYMWGVRVASMPMNLHGSCNVMKWLIPLFQWLIPFFQWLIPLFQWLIPLFCG